MSCNEPHYGFKWFSGSWADRVFQGVMYLLVFMVMMSVFNLVARAL